MADIRDDAASPAPPNYSAPASYEPADDIAQLQALMRSLRRAKITLQRALTAYQGSMTLFRDIDARDDR